ncbi:MAG: hypothetical protein KY455_09850 [Euryarchaeota archaeon]|nr:hypothetical protein [Euryarchaeota archaeon]
MSVTTSGTLRIHHGSTREAEEALRSLAPENEDHLTASLEDDTLVLRLPPRPLGSTLETLDDALACLSAAKGALDALDPDDR